MAAKYRPGDVSATLFGKKKQTDTSKSFLADLFSSPKDFKGSPGFQSDDVKVSFFMINILYQFFCNEFQFLLHTCDIVW